MHMHSLFWQNSKITTQNKLNGILFQFLIHALQTLSTFNLQVSKDVLKRKGTMGCSIFSLSSYVIIFRVSG
jgi:hypothetical protein